MNGSDLSQPGGNFRAVAVAVAVAAVTAVAAKAAGLLAFAVLASASLPALAAEEAWRGADAFDEGDARVEAELLVDADAVAAGEPVRFGVRLSLDPGWHVYWRNAGDSGLPTKLTWQVPQAEVGPVLWPAPRVFRESDGFLTTYGYADEVLLASDAVVSGDARDVLRVAVTVDFVTCEIGCIPGRIALVREVPVRQTGAPPARAVRALFTEAANALPRTPADLGVSVGIEWSQGAVRPGDEFRGALSIFSCAGGRAGPDCAPFVPGASRADEAFLPEQVAGIELGAAGLAREAAGPDAVTLVLAGRASQDDPRVDVQRVRGLVPLRGPDGEHVTLEVDLALPRAAAGTEVAQLPSALFEVGDPLAPAAAAESRAGVAAVSLGTALALGLLGGLILNLMPCVLPILALKVFHVVSLAHERRGNVLAQGAAYTAGVLGSMGVLAGIVTLLRVAGTSVGWGFQFQEPIFIAAIATLLVVFAMNLFGAFEVTFQPQVPAALPGEPVASSRGAALTASFLEGGLAVVLATPCTAPFLGTAVGFAFASSAAVVFAIFFAIGLGLAAPFLLVTLVPAWARLVPKPGAWMLELRRALAFSLIASVVWLLWVAGRSIGVDAQALLLAFLVGVAFLAWIYGALQRSSRVWLSRTAAVATAGAVVLGLGALPLEPLPKALAVGVSVVPAGVAASVAWRPYDPAAIERERALGRPVLVDFTADWCITCKVNETVVLASESVRAELARLDVATFKADWTLYDEDIRAALAQHGRAGVPMVLVYAPGEDAAPEVLPELLTIDLTIRALREAAERGGT